MKLILMRHAKSTWDDPTLEDHARPLNDRGRAGAQAMGQWLADQGHIPDRALVSDAARTRETWALLGVSFAETDVQFERGLYLASPDLMLAKLQRESADTLMLVAHNPGMAMLAEGLVDHAPNHPKFRQYPTAATMVAEFSGESWKALKPGSCKPLAFLTPKDL